MDERVQRADDLRTLLSGPGQPTENPTASRAMNTTTNNRNSKLEKVLASPASIPPRSEAILLKEIWSRAARIWSCPTPSEASPLRKSSTSRLKLSW